MYESIMYRDNKLYDVKNKISRRLYKKNYEDTDEEEKMGVKRELKNGSIL